MQKRAYVIALALCAMLMGACSSTPTQTATTAPADSPTTAPAATVAPATDAAPTEAAATTEAPAATEAPTSAPAGQAPEAQTSGGRLQAVKDRGMLICGVNGGLPGFSNLESDGSYSGFDADFCRVVAAAVLGDASKVEFRPLSAQERFTAVQSGEVDVLFRNTTWTTSRDSSVGMDFGPTTFYDGQGIMVRTDLGASALDDLEGGTICVQSGTTTELNLTDVFRARGITFTPVVFEEIDPTYQAYDEGRCDAVTSDRSQLIARRTTLQDPNAHQILDVVISKEPLGPAVAQGDSQWRDVVSWAVYATVAADEFGITSQNIAEQAQAENPDIRRFLGAEGELGAGLGLPNDFAVKIIQSVGNYDEIYNRNLGPGTPFNLERGPNALWTNGGLMYAPPFR
jgi:general L-amino acid transport system substrate-binding protein